MGCVIHLFVQITHVCTDCTYLYRLYMCAQITPLCADYTSLYRLTDLFFQIAVFVDGHQMLTPDPWSLPPQVDSEPEPWFITGRPDR